MAGRWSLQRFACSCSDRPPCRPSETVGVLRPTRGSAATSAILAIALSRGVHDSLGGIAPKRPTGATGGLSASASTDSALHGHWQASCQWHSAADCVTNPGRGGVRRDCRWISAPLGIRASGRKTGSRRAGSLAGPGRGRPGSLARSSLLNRDVRPSSRRFLAHRTASPAPHLQPARHDNLDRPVAGPSLDQQPCRPGSHLIGLPFECRQP